MAYFGKVFKEVGEENISAFVDTLDIPPEEREQVKKGSPDQKLDKNDDGTYSLTYIIGDKSLPVTFRLGEQFEEIIGTKSTQTIFTLEGDVLTQVQKCRDGNEITFRREFSESELKVAFTSSFWDGVAYRFYKAE